MIHYTLKCTKGHEFDSWRVSGRYDLDGMAESWPGRAGPEELARKMTQKDLDFGGRCAPLCSACHRPGVLLGHAGSGDGQILSGASGRQQDDGELLSEG